MHVKCCVLRGTRPYRNSDYFFLLLLKKRYSYRIWQKFSFCFHSGMLREKSKSVLTSRNITPSWKQQVHQRFLGGKWHNMAISCFSFTWVNKKSLTLQLVSSYIILNRSKYSSSFSLGKLKLNKAYKDWVFFHAQINLNRLIHSCVFQRLNSLTWEPCTYFNTSVNKMKEVLVFTPLLQCCSLRGLPQWGGL